MVATAMGSKVIGPNRKTGLTPQATRTIGGALTTNAIFSPIAAIRKIPGPATATNTEKQADDIFKGQGIETEYNDGRKKKRLKGLRGGGQETLSTLLGE